MTPRLSSWLLAALCAACVAAACKSQPTATASSDAGACACAPSLVPSADSGVASTPRAPLALCKPRGQLPLEAAKRYYDQREYEQSLSCAAKACADAPDDVLAQVARADALVALKRDDEAKLAFARALALSPDSLDALEAAANFYILDIGGDREAEEVGRLYAERGFELARAEHDTESALTFARLAAAAANDLGQSSLALERATWALTKQPTDLASLNEKAFALFELCRFDEAERAFTKLLSRHEGAAAAHEYLALINERKGKAVEATAHFEAATRLDPKRFARRDLISKANFEAEVRAQVATLPADMRRDLTHVDVHVEDLPRDEDLLANEPPLSPGILGLFRGPWLSESCADDAGAPPNGKCRTIILYRLNLARAVKSSAELTTQIRITLLHEIGHLRGEGDEDLISRGLE